MVTGESTAATWSRHLGCDVRYAGDDLDAWEAQTRKFMPDWAVDDWVIMYRYSDPLPDPSGAFAQSY